MFVGDAVMLYGDLWREALGARFASAPRTLHYPSASGLGLLAGEMLQQDQCLDLATAAPLYVRASDAELSLGPSRNKRVRMNGNSRMRPQSFELKVAFTPFLASATRGFFPFISASAGKIAGIPNYILNVFY